MKHKRNVSGVLHLLLLSALVVSSVASVIDVQPVGADLSGVYVHPAIKTEIDRYLYRYALAECMAGSPLRDSTGGWVSRENISAGAWYTNGPLEKTVPVGYSLSSADGKARCSDASFIKSAVQALGWTDLLQAACDIGFMDENSKSYDACTVGGGHLVKQGTSASDAPKIQALIDAHNSANKGTLSTEATYVMYAQILEIGCKATPLQYLSSATAQEKALAQGKGGWTAWLQNTKEGSADGSSAKEVIYRANGTSRDTQVIIRADASGVGNELSAKLMSCINVATVVDNDNKEPWNARAAAYAKYLYTNPATAQTPQAGQGTTGATGAATPESGSTTCSSDMGGMGWVLCPVLSFMATINDKAYGFISDAFLSFDGGMVTDSGVTDTWSTFRNIANVAFVIVFMIIIFSQVTSMGVSGYGIKKMLPRLIITAVLVNMSLIVCQLAVDLSNVVGFGVSNLFSAINVTQGSANGTMLAGGVSWVTAVGLAIGGVGALVAVFLSVAALPSALLAIGAVMLILIARKAIIIILVIVSPIAFVAYLLPNTENLFKKWYKLFFSMLILFPVVGMVFGASKLAANILAKTAGKDPVLQLTALIVSALPFFVVPGLLKSSLDATGKIGSAIGGLSSKANARLGSKVKNETQLGRGWSSAMANRAQNRAARQTTALARNPLKRGLARLAGGKGFDTSLINKAAALEDKDFEEGVAASKSKFSDMTFSNIEAVANDKRASEVDRTAAIRHIMEKGNFAQRQTLIESSSAMTARQKAAVSDGAIARGDHMIYGASIGDAIKSGKIQGADDTKKLVAQNIAAGKVKPEAMVHDADAVKLMADVLASGTQFELTKKDAAGKIITDAAGNVLKETRALTAQERTEVGNAARDAQRLPGTSSKVSKLFTDQYARL